MFQRPPKHFLTIGLYDNHMKRPTSGNRKELGAQFISETILTSVVRTLKVAMEDSKSRESQNGKIVHMFLLIDITEAIRDLLGEEETKSKTAERTLKKAVDTEPDKATTSTQSDDQGRGILSKLLLLGAVVGVGYVLKSRSGSMDKNKILRKVSDQAQSVADETTKRSSKIAERTGTVTEQTSEKIQQGGETAADQVQEEGQKAADQINKAAETAENTSNQQVEGGEESSNEEE